MAGRSQSNPDLAPFGPGRRLLCSNCSHRVVARFVGDFRHAKRLEERREVYPKAAAVALTQPVPASNRVIG